MRPKILDGVAGLQGSGGISVARGTSLEVFPDQGVRAASRSSLLSLDLRPCLLCCVGCLLKVQIPSFLFVCLFVGGSACVHVGVCRRAS